MTLAAPPASHCWNSYRYGIFLLNSDFSCSEKNYLWPRVELNYTAQMCTCLEALDPPRSCVLPFLQLFLSLWLSQQGRSWHHPGNLHVISLRKNDSLSIFHLILGLWSLCFRDKCELVAQIFSPDCLNCHSLGCWRSLDQLAGHDLASSFLMWGQLMVFHETYDIEHCVETFCSLTSRRILAFTK